MASFFTYPLEAIAETFLTEGALTVPTLTEGAKGVGAIGTIVAGAALPSIIKSTKMGKRKGNTLSNFPPKIHRRFQAPTPERMPGSFKRAVPGPTEGDEIAVVPPPKVIALTAPDYFTIKLPWALVAFYSNAAVPTGNNIRTFRLNSVFDPDSSSGSSHQPMGRDTWAGVYKYYRVLATHVMITTINQQNKSESSGPKNACMIGMEHTDDTSSTGLTQNINSFMESKNSDSHLLLGRDNSPANINTMHFNYTPGSWTDHVHETGVEERWTPIGDNPSFVHDLAYRAFPISGGDVSAYDLHYKIHITYTVQFRELQHSVYKTEDA
jgi:hypothetical protein